MSRCGKTEQLEAMVMGELNLAHATELEMHTTRCAVCHHELHWLKSEQVMFEQRLAREQVQQLWDGFAKKRAAPQRYRAWGRWALAAAASAVLMVGLSSSSIRRGPTAQNEAFDDTLSMSLEEMSREIGSTSRDCSELRPGMGFACGPYLPASFVARR